MNIIIENTLHKIAIQTSNFDPINSVDCCVNPKFSRVFYISNLPKEEINFNINSLNRVAKCVFGYGVTEIVDKLPDNKYLVENVIVNENETIIKLPKEFVYDGMLQVTEDLKFIINVLDGKLFR